MCTLVEIKVQNIIILIKQTEMGAEVCMTVDGAPMSARTWGYMTYRDAEELLREYRSEDANNDQPGDENQQGGG